MTVSKSPIGKMKALGFAWFLPEDYQRIRQLSDDEMQPTFEAFEAKMARLLPQIEAQLPPCVSLEKVIVKPDELLAFADRLHGGKINSQVRGSFAAAAVAQKYGSEN